MNDVEVAKEHEWGRYYGDDGCERLSPFKTCPRCGGLVGTYISEPRVWEECTVCEAVYDDQRTR